MATGKSSPNQATKEEAPEAPHEDPLYGGGRNGKSGAKVAKGKASLSIAQKLELPQGEDPLESAPATAVERAEIEEQTAAMPILTEEEALELLGLEREPSTTTSDKAEWESASCDSLLLAKAREELSLDAEDTGAETTHVFWADLVDSESDSDFDHEFERLHDLSWVATKTFFPAAVGDTPRRRKTRSQRKLRQSCNATLAAHCKKSAVY
jgi:hypothetical protein